MPLEVVVELDVFGAESQTTNQAWNSVFLVLIAGSREILSERDFMVLCCGFSEAHQFWWSQGATA